MKEIKSESTLDILNVSSFFSIICADSTFEELFHGWTDDIDFTITGWGKVDLKDVRQRVLAYRAQSDGLEDLLNLNQAHLVVREIQSYRFERENLMITSKIYIEGVAVYVLISKRISPSPGSKCNCQVSIQAKYKGNLKKDTIEQALCQFFGRRTDLWINFIGLQSSSSSDQKSSENDTNSEYSIPSPAKYLDNPINQNTETLGPQSIEVYKNSALDSAKPPKMTPATPQSQTNSLISLSNELGVLKQTAVENKLKLNECASTIEKRENILKDELDLEKRILTIITINLPRYLSQLEIMCHSQREQEERSKELHRKFHVQYDKIVKALNKTFGSHPNQNHNHSAVDHNSQKNDKSVFPHIIKILLGSSIYFKWANICFLLLFLWTWPLVLKKFVVWIFLVQKNYRSENFLRLRDSRSLNMWLNFVRKLY
eukprot:TRINITY_DN5970_c0_g1_i1.p1 TRINITY_DN5970_c0_g1~~TRINITY_DN5970_c0_g1_i1.p1  ORF type:complete len:429 (+),score=23.74 TRINITY_DN5970_c0_g1_i1:40-1326(+)